MFTAHLRPIVRHGVTAAALVAFALVFTPAVVIISGPPGYLSLSLAMASGATCISLAWVKWSVDRLEGPGVK